MVNKFQGTWYVSFERRWGKREYTRATETFPNEREAKKFARAKLAETKKVSAGTLNPHLPKRTIAPAQMLEWLEEPDEDAQKPEKACQREPASSENKLGRPA